jgi:hypothetical protein
MNTYLQQIDLLDSTIFDAIKSQTSTGERRSLLAIQRVTAKKHTEFSYLEIGSYLGGSIQPYLLDDRCKVIYSIDPRPAQQPDDGAGRVVHYPANTTENMLNLLASIGHGDIGKIECIESNEADINPALIRNKPEIAFIDGEHTRSAVVSDFNFCEKVISRSGTIIFHDFSIIYPAIADICMDLKQKHRNHVALKLEDSVFAIFFDAERIKGDSYLSWMYKKNRHYLHLYLLGDRLKRMLPNTVFRLIWAFYRQLSHRQ